MFSVPLHFITIKSHTARITNKITTGKYFLKIIRSYSKFYASDSFRVSPYKVNSVLISLGMNIRQTLLLELRLRFSKIHKI